SDALMEQVERTARLIRSKGVGVYFVTQAPTDVPSSVLAQLGNRVQHALRAFTPEDADALKKTARTFPMTEFYDVEKQITSLGIGEALVTVLSPRGVPTPLAATRLLAPDSLMAALAPAELQGRISTSMLHSKYGATVDRDSAKERLDARIEAGRAAAAQSTAAYGGAPAGTPGPTGGMTPAQYRQEIERQVREQRAAEKAAAREAKAAETERKREERERQRTVNTAIRTGGRVITSRLGQSLIKGVFGAIFGRKR
ncbi:MAG TPA: helicase HerA-like domain-containing protein, partial [Candidatus Limnocylindrales bacterium]|nr:helicase HerA-like domain-containing protein [Candidatus Limnocylindrales bacterium]